jgi:negative regulator of flagellin synthesis FlgM
LTLSVRARLLSAARAALAEAPDVRADKVDALRQAVETGTYQVPYDRLARRLVARL